MAVIKLRNANGEVYEITSIRGEKGDTGEVDYTRVANALQGTVRGNPMLLRDISPFCRDITLSANVGGVTAMVYGKNLLDLARVSSFTRCSYDPNTGMVTSNIDNSYYCSIAVTYLNDLLMASRGKTLTFSVNQPNESAGTTILIYGTIDGADTYQTVESLGKQTATIVVDERFTAIRQMVFRFNQFAKPHTDQTSVIGAFQLEVGDKPTTYEPYIAPKTMVADGAGYFPAMAVSAATHTVFTAGEVTLTAAYTRDLNRVIAAIEEAIR